MRAKREIEVVINFTEGWEERVAKAAYNLYLSLENKEEYQCQA